MSAPSLPPRPLCLLWIKRGFIDTRKWMCEEKKVQVRALICSLESQELLRSQTSFRSTNLPRICLLESQRLVLHHIQHVQKPVVAVCVRVLCVCVCVSAHHIQHVQEPVLAVCVCVCVCVLCVCVSVCVCVCVFKNPLLLRACAVCVRERKREGGGRGGERERDHVERWRVWVWVCGWAGGQMRRQMHRKERLP